MKKEHYLKLIKDLYAKIGRTEDYQAPGWTIQSEILLYKQTGDFKYMEGVIRDMRKKLTLFSKGGILEPDMNVTGFKLPPRIAAATRFLLDEDVFSENEKIVLNGFIGELLSHSEYERGPMNRAVGFMAGLNPLRKIHGPHPEDKDLNELEETLSRDWLNHCEPEERAYGYEALTYLFLMEWMETGGHENWYELPAMKKGLENLLFSRGGNGRCAAYGDWRPWEPCWGLYIAVFEKAAAVYQDGRFKFMAHQIFLSWEEELKTDAEQVHHDIMGLSFAHRWCDDAVEPIVPTENPGIITRNSGLLERLVLRSGGERNALFGTLSLSDRDEHGHCDTLALSGLQAAGRMLDDNGRETYHTYCHNLLYTADESEDFPVPRYSETPGKEQTIRLDFDSVRHYGHFQVDPSIPVKSKHAIRNDLPREFNFNPKEEWVLLMKWLGIGSYTVRIREIRLVSESETTVISDFVNEKDKWVGLTDLEGDTGVFHFDFTGHVPKNLNDPYSFEPQFLGRHFPYPLDLDNGPFEALEIDFVMDGQLPAEDFHLICLGGKEGYPRQWYSYELPHFKADILFHHDRELYIHSLCRSRGHTRLRRSLERTRELFLLKNRLLWIRDTVDYGDDLPHTSGPLWQIKRVISQGENWLCSREDQKLLVYFLPKEGATIHLDRWEGSELEIRGSRYNPYTYYQKLTAPDGGSQYFETLLIPLEEGEDPEQIAGQIKIAADGSGGVTRILLGDEELEFPK